jgi:hypothetical protein
MHKSPHSNLLFLKPDKTHFPGSRRSTQQMKPEAPLGEEVDKPSIDFIIWQLSATLTFSFQLMPNSCLVTDNIYEVIKRYSN